MPTGVYERPPKGEPKKRDYKAEWARRKAGKPKRGQHWAKGTKWTAARKKKFQATMKRKRVAREAHKADLALNRLGKQQLLNGGPRPVGRPKGSGRAPTVTVLQDDGTLATYALTTVQAYVRQP